MSHETAAEAKPTFPSAGKRITIEWFGRAPAGRTPGILMLHGRDGPYRFADAYRGFAAVFAHKGYSTLFPHYFEATESTSLFGREGLSNAAAWMRTVADAIDWVAGQSEIDAGRLGLVGISLGTSLALAQAARDTRIKAVVAFYGMLPVQATAAIRRMPPTLILHGAQDWVVPVAAAHQLDALLQRIGAEHELHIYPGQGHGFQGAAGRDAARRSLHFFERHLA